MKISVISFTKQGTSLNKKIKQLLEEKRHKVTSYYYGTSFFQLSELVKELFETKEAIIFIGACAIAVRSVAPYLKGKTKDPAVLVMDELGGYVIPILSGHIGGANELAKEVSNLLKATPVITTATDLNKEFAVDVWAKKKQLQIVEWDLAKQLSASVLNGEEVGAIVEGVSCELPPVKKLNKEATLGMLISYDDTWNPFPKTLHLVPKDLVLGVGCKRGTPYEVIVDSIKTVFKEYRLSIYSIMKICSINQKKKEEGILQLSKELEVPFITYSAEELKRVEGKVQPSAFVLQQVGVDNVCERSALLGSGAEHLKIRKQKKKGITIAVARRG